MADGIVANTEGFVEAHPIGALSIGVGVVLLLWYMSSGSSSNSTGGASPDNANIAAAAQIGAAQIAANAQTQQTQIAADAATAQTQIAANAQVALQTVQSNAALGTAQAQASASIAGSNASVAQTQIAANADVAENYNSGIVTEFTSLLSALTSYGNTVSTNTTSVINSAIGMQNQGAGAEQGAQAVLAQAGFGNSLSSFSNGLFGETASVSSSAANGAGNSGAPATFNSDVAGQFASLQDHLQSLVPTITQTNGPIAAGSAAAAGLTTS